MSPRIGNVRRRLIFFRNCHHVIARFMFSLVTCSFEVLGIDSSLALLYAQGGLPGYPANPLLAGHDSFFHLLFLFDFPLNMFCSPGCSGTLHAGSVVRVNLSWYRLWAKSDCMPLVSALRCSKIAKCKSMSSRSAFLLVFLKRDYVERKYRIAY